MFNFIEIVFGGIACLFVLMFLSNQKLRRRIYGLWRRKGDEVADNFGNVITDTKDAIHSAKVGVESFENQLANAKANIKVAQNEHAKQVKEAEKYGELAARAAKAGDEKNARVFLTKKQAAEKLALNIAAQNEKNIALTENLVSQLTNRRDQIRSAELDIVIQEARQSGLDMRSDMMKAASSFTNINSLDQARKELDLYEARLDAKEELSGDNLDKVEQLYTVDTEVDKELKSLMESVNNESVSQTSR